MVDQQTVEYISKAHAASASNEEFFNPNIIDHKNKFVHITKNILFNLFLGSFKNVIIPIIIYVIPDKKYRVVKISIPSLPPIFIAFFS